MHLDIFIQNYISNVRTANLTEFFYLLTSIFDASLHFVLVVVCVSVLLYLFRGKRYGVFFLTSIGLGTILVYILKIAFNVSRPTGGVVEVFSKSFPSGHATIATIFFIMLIYTFDDFLKGLWRHLFNFVSVSMVLLVAFSRIYLGVHWVSDVLFGIFLGCLVCYFVVKFLDKVINRLPFRLW